MLYLCNVIQKESPTDLTDLHRFSSLQATVLTKAHSKDSARSQKSVKICEICGKIQHYKKMDLRSYTKQELALLYFPDSDPDVARAHLMRWIVRCTQLYEQLLKSGYNKSCKEFNPLQVSYIFFHLGEP